MKDYAMSYHERVKFILNYEIKNDIIVINYANGIKKEVPYSRKEEEQILLKMQNQVLNSGEFADEIISNFSSIAIPMGGMGYGSSLSLLNNIINNFNNSQISGNLEGIIPLVAVCFLVSIISTVKGIKYYSLIRDIDKNNLFNSNNYYMNYNMRIEDKYLEGLSSTAKDIIRGTKDGDNVFTFNTIDKMSYSDVKRVLENIERYTHNEEDYTPRFKKRTRR